MEGLSASCHIKVVLHGTKLRGGFALVRIGKLSPDGVQKKRWLMIKHRDEHADPSWRIESTELDRPVLTGRTLKEIEEAAAAKRARRT